MRSLVTTIGGLLAAGAVMAAAPERASAQGTGGGLVLQLVEQFGGEVNAIAAAGHLAYVGVGPRLVVLDAGDPDAPHLVGRSEVLPGVVADLDAAGDYAFVLLDSVAGLQVLDVADPARPKVVGSLAVERLADRVSVSELASLLLLGSTFESYVEVIDISVPSSPRRVSGIDVQALGDVLLAGRTAFIIDNDSDEFVAPARLSIIDLTEPVTPIEVAAVEFENLGFDVQLAFDGGLLYAKLEGAGPTIIDVSEPTRPLIVGSMSLVMDSNFDVADGYIYIPGESGVGVFDASDPAELRFVGGLQLPDWNSGPVQVEGDRLYVRTGLGIHTAEISDPIAPRMGGLWQSPSRVVGVADRANTVLLADGSPRIWSWRSAPSYPVEMTTSQAGDDSLWDVDFMALTGGALYTASAGISPGQVRRYDVESSGPILVGSSGDLPSIWGLDADGDHVGVIVDASNSHGLMILDGTDESALPVAGFVPSPGLDAVELALGHAFLPTADLDVFDLSAGGVPRDVAHVPIPGGAEAVHVFGERAYVVGSRLHVLDVRPPSSARILGGTAVAGRHVRSDGRIAYVLSERAVSAVDVADPTSPARIAEYPLGVVALTISRGLVYLASDTSGMFVLRLFPAAPRSIYLPDLGARRP